MVWYSDFILGSLKSLWVNIPKRVNNKLKQKKISSIKNRKKIKECKDITIDPIEKKHIKNG